jgi:hypothetical protein
MNLDQQDPSASGSADTDPLREKTRKRKRNEKGSKTFHAWSRLDQIFIFDRKISTFRAISTEVHITNYLSFFTPDKNDFWNFGSGSRVNNAGSTQQCQHGPALLASHMLIPQTKYSVVEPDPEPIEYRI